MLFFVRWQKEDTLPESPNIRTFLLKFWPNVGARMSGGASVPLAALAIYFNNAPLKALFACLAAFGVVAACYQVWVDTVSGLQKTIAEGDTEIKRLKQRAYDEEHRRLAEGKVENLSEVSKDLVWYLLHYGETETTELWKKCRHTPEFNDATQRARDAGLVLDSRTGNPGQGRDRYFWKINAQFETVLQDLLGDRKTVYFQ